MGTGMGSTALHLRALDYGMLNIVVRILMQLISKTKYTPMSPMMSIRATLNVQHGHK